MKNHQIPKKIPLEYLKVKTLPTASPTTNKNPLRLDAAKKWGDTLGKEGITWLDKLKIWAARNTFVGKVAPGVFGEAGKAAAAAKDAEEAAKAQKGMFTEQEKEKIKRLKDFDTSKENVKKADELLNSVKKGDVKKLGKDEQMLKVTNDQLTTLLAIEENTRQTAEDVGEEAIKGEKTKEPIKYISKDLRSKLDELKQERLGAGGDTATKLKDLLAAAVLVASGGYLAQRGQLGAELGEATKRAEKINSAFGDLVNKFPNEVETLIKEMQMRRSKMLEPSAEGIKTDRKSLLLDTSEAYNEFLSKLEELADKARVEAIKSGEIIGEAKDKMYLKQTAFDIAASIEDFAKTIIDASIDLETGLSLRTQTIGAMKGLPTFEEISMGKLPSELTATERLMKEGGPAWQNMYKTFKTLDNVRENLIGLVQSQAKGIVGSQVNLWAETIDQRQTIENERKSIIGVTGKLTAKADPGVANVTTKIREIAEKYNQSLDIKSITDEIKSKEGDLKTLKMDSQRLVAKYREAIKPPDMTAMDKAFEEFVSAGWFQQFDPVKMENERAKSIAQSLSGVNSKVIATRQHIGSLKELETELGNTKLGKAAADLRTRITETMERIKMQVDVYGNLKEAAKEVTVLMEQLHEVLATGLNIQQLIGDFEQMKSSFTLDELQQQFIEAADTFEQIRRGGAAPNAPVWPTFEMMQAGMSSEQMRTATRRDAAMASIVAQGRMPTGEELQRIDFDDKLRTVQYKQAKEDDKLNRQRSTAAELHRRILEAQRRAGMVEGEENSDMRKALISRFEEIRTNLIKQSSIAGETRREISPGVYERYGYDFDSIEMALKSIGSEYGETGKDLVSGIGDISTVMDQLGLGEYSPVVAELTKANDYLALISKNTGATPEIIKSIQEKTLKPIGVPEKTGFFQGGGPGAPSGASGDFATKKSPFVNPVTWWRELFFGKQSGGSITGPGGPKDDSVPIMASPGEFIVKAASAKKLGKSQLEYMNKTGMLPGFQKGGEVPEWMRKNPNLAGLYGGVGAAGKALGKGFLDIGRMAAEPFIDIYKGTGNYAANLIYAATSMFPQAKGALMGLGQVIKGPLGQKATQQLVRQAGSYLKTMIQAPTVAKSITKATTAGKYADEITEMIMGTRTGQTNLGYALGARASEDVKMLGTMSKLHKQLNVAYKTASKSGDFDQAMLIGSKLQGLREGREFATSLIAIRKGKTPPVNSATDKAIEYAKKGMLPNLPKLNLPLMKRRGLGMLAEETGLAVPGGAAQMVGEIVGASAKKSKKLLKPIGKLEMESYATKPKKGAVEGALPKKGVIEGAFETILERRQLKEAEDLLMSVQHVGGGTSIPHSTVREIFTESPYKKDILRSIPKGAKRIEGVSELGTTAIVFELPGDKILRIGDKLKPRLNIPEMLQAEVRKEFGEHQLEIIPKADKVGAATKEQLDYLKNIISNRGKSVGKKYEFWDYLRSENVGFVGDKPVVIDPGAIKYRMGGKILESYAKGTSFVPEDQLAMVHKGERIIPAKYNKGGAIELTEGGFWLDLPRENTRPPKRGFSAGGGANALNMIESAGEKIGDAILKKIEEADITLNVPDKSDIPVLEIGNLDDLKAILEGGSVGAARTSKLDQFIDSATNKFDRLEEQSVDNTTRITMVEAQTSGIKEIGTLKLSISDLENKIVDVYTTLENRIDSDRENSYMETRLHETVSDLKTDDILPIKSNIIRMELVISDLARSIDNQYDILYSNINRLGIS